MTTPDYRFMRRPRWILGGVIAVGCAVLFVNFGFWQLRRLEERRDGNAVVAARTGAPVVDLESVPLPDADLPYRTASVTGRYATEEEVLLRNRSRRGASGYHVLTPLELEDGRGVVIDRGWVPLDVAGPPVAEAGPPPGAITVVGVVRSGGRPDTRSQPREGTLARISSVDLARFDDQTRSDLLPVYLELQDQIPEQTAALPLSLDLPELSEGSHLGYAVQWFAFAAIAVAGFVVLVVRTGRDAIRRGPERVSRRGKTSVRE